MDKPEQSPGLLESMGNFIARKGRRAWPLTVTAKEQISPRMVRVKFSGSDLNELNWIRGQDVVLELPRADGSLSRRHYTIRNHDPEARMLAIDFVLHGEGASGRWLESLQPGDTVDAVGPRGHTYLRDADWHLFCGDETCLPGIAAMIEGLPRGTRAVAFIEVDSEADAVPPDADAVITWLFRNGKAPGPSTLLFNAIEGFALPEGGGFAYIIGETSNVRAIRHRLIERGLSRERIASEGYWRPGRIGGHDHI